MSAVHTDTVWTAGRFDLRRGPPRVLFGRMYEDFSIELAAFPPGGRVFCIASAGCTAIALSTQHDVVAVDINPAQLTYAAARIAGAPMVLGTAEQLMRVGRAMLGLAGWRRATVDAFLDMEEPATQREYWREHLDSRRFRAGIDALLSVSALRGVYASPYLACLPARFGAVMRKRLERCIGTHPNRANRWLRALFAGELSTSAPPPAASAIRLVRDDAASFIERAPPGSIDGFALSNILDGATEHYRQRLYAAIGRAASPRATVVLRSFGEPADDGRYNRVADERSPLWGVVDVRPAAALAA